MSSTVGTWMFHETLHAGAGATSSVTCAFFLARRRVQRNRRRSHAGHPSSFRWANGEDREAPVGSFVDEDDDDADGEKDGEEKEVTGERESSGTSSGGGGSGDTADSLVIR